MNDKPRINVFVIAGIALPMVLVALMLLAQGVGGMMVADPTHDAVFVLYQNNKPGNEEYQFKVENGHLVVKAALVERQIYRTPSLYVYDAQKKNIREISLPSPKPEDVAAAAPAPTGTEIEGIVTPKGLEHLNPLADTKFPKFVEVEIPELKNVKINPYKISSDGYSFEWSGRSYGNLFFWGGGNYSSGYVLKKGARRIALPLGETPYYYGTDNQFIGWVE